MSESTPRTLTHYALVAFAPEYWSLDTGARALIQAEWLAVRWQESRRSLRVRGGGVQST